MSLTPNGINYICQKYGDETECVVSTGLIFDYTDTESQTYTDVAGNTSSIVGFISLGIVQSITMKTPSRPTITNPMDKLDQANGSHVTLTDAQTLAEHDESSADPWCYQAPQNCSNPYGQEGNYICGDASFQNAPLTGHRYHCESGTWADKGEDPVCLTPCEDKTQEECVEPCYWYNEWLWEQPSCHSKPLDPTIQYLIYAGIALAGLGIVVYLIKKRRQY